jgi:hypothetical protein
MAMVDYAGTKNGIVVLVENEREYVLGVMYELDDDTQVRYNDICGKRHMNKGSWTYLEVLTRFQEVIEEVKNANGMLWG